MSSYVILETTLGGSQYLCFTDKEIRLRELKLPKVTQLISSRCTVQTGFNPGVEFTHFTLRSESRIHYFLLSHGFCFLPTRLEVFRHVFLGSQCSGKILDFPSSIFNNFFCLPSSLIKKCPRNWNMI